MLTQAEQDHIVFVEAHHFRGTRIVACCITLKDGRVVLATEEGPPLGNFNITHVAAAARQKAEQQVAALVNNLVTPAA